MSYARAIRGKIRLLFQLARINLRISIVTLIGLTIALSMAAACLIYLESTKTDFYLAIFEEDSFQRPMRYRNYQIGVQSKNYSDILSMQEALENNIANHELSDFFVKQPLTPTCSIDGSLKFLNQSEEQLYRNFLGVELVDSVLNDCIEGSDLPATWNEVIVISPSISPLNLGDSFNISRSYYPNPDSDIKAYYNFTVTISGIITPESLGKESPLRNVEYVVSIDRITLLTDNRHYIALFNEVVSDINTIANRTNSISLKTDFYYNPQISYINHTNVVDIVPVLLTYTEETRRSFRIGDFEFNNYSYSSFYGLRYRIAEFSNYFSVFLLLSIPSFLLTILLISFSLSLINERRKKSLVLFKMRGVSNKFIFVILIIESLVIAILASFMGFILGVPFSVLISTTTGYLTFNARSINVIISQSILQIILIMSLLFTFISHIRPMYRLAKSPIAILDQEAGRKKERKVGMFRGNIDLFLLTQGTLGIVLLTLLMQNLTTAGGELIMVSLPIILLLLIVSPFTFLIGFIFAFNRFIPIIIHHTGTFFWKKDWGLLATATRNLSVNAKLTGRTTLLIACSISFLMILSSLPVSFHQYSVDSIYYQAGSDLQILSYQYSSETIQELTTQLQSIPGLSFTHVETLSVWIDTNGGYRIDFLGIDNNFHQIAHWQNNYDDESLQTLVSALYASSATYPVIIDSISAREEKLDVDGIYESLSGKSETLEFVVEGIAHYWPTLIERGSNEDRFIVTKRSLLGNISTIIMEASSSYSDLQENIWCKILTGYDYDNVTAQVWNVSQNLGIQQSSFKSIRDDHDLEAENLEGKFIWVITNFNFIASLAVILFVIVLFTFTRVTSHSTEIGLSRALGMKYKQVFVLMFIEPFLLFLISGIPGGIMGVILLIGFVSFMGPSFLYGPPFVLDFNILALLLIYSSILLVTILTGLITSFMATRANISKILKVE